MTPQITVYASGLDSPPHVFTTSVTAFSTSDDKRYLKIETNDGRVHEFFNIPYYVEHDAN